MCENKDFYYKKSRLNQLRAFCAVVQNDCSGVKAAEKLFIAATAVSKRIITLEDDIGVQLFDRSVPHKLILTKEGKDFYELASAQLNGLESLFDNFNEYTKEKNKNTLNLGLYYTAAAYIFPKILGKLLTIPDFKDLKINIHNISRDEAIQSLIKRDIDFAFFPISSVDTVPLEIEIQKKLRYNHALICSKNHPLAKVDKITERDIEKYDFLIRDLKSSFSIFEHLNLKRANIGFKNANTEITIELVKETNKITALPEIILNRQNTKVHPDIICKNINHLLPESYFYSMVTKGSIKKDSVNWLLQELDNGISRS